LFLPLSGFLPERSRDRNQSAANQSPSRREELELDAILEKISKQGIDSLSREEKVRLDSVSEKYRRRSDSKKPESDLFF
jgi:hypothetical protein